MPASLDPPSFQFYPRDWIVDTRHLTRDQRCRYWDALCDAWVSRSYGVASEDQWRQWLGYTAEEWPSERVTYLRLFKVRGDRWTQQRMHSERQSQMRRHERASAGGKLAQESLRNKRLGSTAQIKQELGLKVAYTPASDSASDSAKSKPLSRAKRSVRQDWKDAFNRFWETCQKKVGKHAALQAWLKLQPADPAQDEDLFNSICDAMEFDSAKWHEEKRELRYYPYPSTWLNQRRWLDHTEEAHHG